ncbi:MAG: glycoside hydrolase family 127 protein [Planctomycetes bacterium]|nr:glycoside hydrolase family 127 protein [Planctomycetota bacterium]
MRSSDLGLAVLVLFLGATAASASPPGDPLSRPVVPAAVHDVWVPVAPDKSFAGYLGTRMRVNLEKRLDTLNLDSILEPYEKRPGKQDWAGEHVGKFLHAAALVWSYTGDQRLKERMDEAVRQLIATQLPDGYLGTYEEKRRTTSWDVWAHKYNLLGLLAYYGVTGDEKALQASRRIGDYLCHTYGPGKKKINTGPHHGMAATSVLEPMVLLYRDTGDKKYLDFCYYIVAAQTEMGLIPSLLAEHADVHRTVNGKAYEMLSNLVGLLELYRLTGDEKFLRPGVHAWEDIMARRHYITGTASWAEHFPDDFDLQGEDASPGMGEGCVTVTWLQLNWQLLRLTGEARYGDEIERIIYNALLAAQSPVKGNVCYFTPLSGHKPYGEVSHGIPPDVSCCASSLPRGIGLIPYTLAGLDAGSPAIVLYNPETMSFPVRADDGQPVTAAIQMTTDFPESGRAVLTVEPSRPAGFTLKLRVPSWCSRYTASVDGQRVAGKPGQFLDLHRTWKTGDKIDVVMDMPVQVLKGGDQEPLGKRYPHKVALQRGPQVLAQDSQVTGSSFPKGWVGTQIYGIRVPQAGKDVKLILVPYADAGQNGGQYQALFDSFSLRQK